MGYEQNRAIVVTVDVFLQWDEDRSTGDTLKLEEQRVREFVEQLRSLRLPDDDRSFLPVTDPVRIPVNSGWFFAIGPDGSKRGWAWSDAADRLREEACKLMDNHNKVSRKASIQDATIYFSYCEVQYNDDNGVSRILNTTDEQVKV